MPPRLQRQNGLLSLGYAHQCQNCQSILILYKQVYIQYGKAEDDNNEK